CVIARARGAPIDNAGGPVGIVAGHGACSGQRRLGRGREPTHHAGRAARAGLAGRAGRAGRLPVGRLPVGPRRLPVGPVQEGRAGLAWRAGRAGRLPVGRLPVGRKRLPVGPVQHGRVGGGSGGGVGDDNACHVFILARRTARFWVVPVGPSRRAPHGSAPHVP